ncbi:MAG: hypothetical protein KDK30_15435 [Leptospiraceae bacterium]|nr:hypothetical protein [Leptospiraceae bacterium]
MQKHQILIYFTVLISLTTACTYSVGGADGPELALLGLLNDGSQLNNSSSTTVDPGRFVAVGNSGQIWYSDDGGNNWTDVSPGGQNLNGIAYNGSAFVAVGNNGQVHYSSNGISWTPTTAGATTLRWVATNGSRIVAVGNAGTVKYSDDGGQTWLDSSPGGANMLSVTYGNGHFVAVGDSGNTWWSTDGIVWNNVLPGGAGNFKAVSYGNGLFVGVAWNSESWYSSDNGQSYTLGTVPIQNTGTPGLMSGLTFGNGQFISIEWQGYMLSTLTSQTGQWNTHGAIGDARGLAYGADRYLGVGYGSNVIYSADGATWSTISSGTVASPLLAIAHAPL